MTTEQRLTRLEQGLQDLGRRLGILELCVGKKLTFRRHNVTWFEPEGNPDLPLWDILPAGCLEEKAIIFTVDATLYCECYEDGWRVEYACHGGLEI